MHGFGQHDHSHCVVDSVAAARAHCEAEGLKLTPTREKVLRILLKEHRAFGAYEVLEHLKDDGLSAQPPTAYRALEFLVEQGFAHKIERLNAFIACGHPGESHTPAFLICRSCSSVAEAQSETAKGSLGRTAREAGFQIERTVVEAEGICPKCQPESAQ